MDKQCSKCKTIKPVDEFHRQKAAKDGRNTQCKACIAEHNAKYYRANRPRIREQHAEYYRSDREGKAKRDARYRAANRERIAEYHAANPHLWWEQSVRYRAGRFGFTPLIESFTRDELIARWGDACYLCNGNWDQLEHVTPVSRGGAHSLENCRPVCGPCNRRAWAEYRRAETA